MRERVAVERLHYDVNLLLEQVAVGVPVEHGVSINLNLAGMIASAYAEDGAPSGENVRRSVVLREAQRVPHRCDVEAAADLDVVGDVAKVDRFHQQIADALVALALEVVLCHPEGIVALIVHGYGDCVRLVKN